MSLQLGNAREELFQIEKMWEIQGETVRLDIRVGKGAFGEVWKASADVSDLPVAVKLTINPEIASEESVEVSPSAHLAKHFCVVFHLTFCPRNTKEK